MKYSGDSTRSVQMKVLDEGWNIKVSFYSFNLKHSTVH